MLVGVISSSCRENNQVSSKAGALIILKALASLPIDVELLEQQEPTQAFNTIVDAPIVQTAAGVEVEKDTSLSS